MMPGPDQTTTHHQPFQGKPIVNTCTFLDCCQTDHYLVKLCNDLSLAVATGSPNSSTILVIDAIETHGGYLYSHSIHGIG